MSETSSADSEIELLRQFVPLFSLSDERLRELAALSSREAVNPGVHLFHEGDVDNQTVYLLRGEVRLFGTSHRGEESVVAGTPEARHPLADRQPRQTSALAASEVVVLRIDNNVLDYMITWDQMAALHREVALGLADDNSEAFGWMNTMLNSLPFKNIPAANMRKLVDRMETFAVKEGEVIVRQGEPGDFYYLIDKGRARVTQQIHLADLDEGSSFGEEALVAEVERNATVTMLTDGSVLRLSKNDFDQLLKEPLISWVSVVEARELVNQGALWLDVRHAHEYHYYRLPNALNLPLHELRQRMAELDRSVSYICYCKTGRRSSAAAFLLSQAGLDVHVLRGGLQVLPPVMRK